MLTLFGQPNSVSPERGERFLPEGEIGAEAGPLENLERIVEGNGLLGGVKCDREETTVATVGRA